MSSIGTRGGRLALFAALLLAAPLSAQETPAQAAAAPAAEELQGWISEIQDIHHKLEAIQRKALEDPELAASQAALGASIKAAMQQADPSLPAAMERVAALETEAQAAQQAGDDAKLQALGAEAEQIQAQFAAAQQKALGQPELAAQVQSFQERLETRMHAVDPAAPQLISRYKELEDKLSAMMGGA